MLSGSSRVDLPSFAAKLVGVGSLVAGSALGCLVVVEELARRVRPGLRLLALAAVGAATGVVMIGTGVWVSALASGKGLDGAVHELGVAAEKIARRAQDPLVMGACLLLGVTAIGASRIGAWPGRPGWVPRVHVQALLSGLAGLLAYVLPWAFLPLGEKDRTWIPVMFVLMAAGASVGLWLGERVEERLLRAWDRWRDRD